MVAQKLQHNFFYSTPTWADIICWARLDLHEHNLGLTEVLILKHIESRIWLSANSYEVIEWVNECHKHAMDAYLRYEKFLGPSIMGTLSRALDSANI